VAKESPDLAKSLMDTAIAAPFLAFELAELYRPDRTGFVVPKLLPFPKPRPIEPFACFRAATNGYGW